jgi:hypothetical protein
MIISDEEHVSLAIRAEWEKLGDGQPMVLLIGRRLARAAIASMGEREGVSVKTTGLSYVGSGGGTEHFNSAPPPAPAEDMRAKTIDGCEEHVALALAPWIKAGGDTEANINSVRREAARAAIAAMSEREEEPKECPDCKRSGGSHFAGCSKTSPDPAEAMRAKTKWADAKPPLQIDAKSIVPPSPPPPEMVPWVELGRALALPQGQAMRYTRSSTVLSVPAAELMAEKAAEAMRAKCEARISRMFAARREDGWNEAITSAVQAIAALKGKP